MPSKKKAAAKKSPAKKTTTTKRKTASRVVGAAKRRYSRKSGGKRTNLISDIGATVGGAVLAGIAGGQLAKQGVDSKIAGIAPAAVGGLLAWKAKSPFLKALGVGMVVAAGINVANNLTKQAAGLAGDSGLDALDVYNNPALLGVPAYAQLGIPVVPDVDSSMQGDENFHQSTGWEVSNLL